MSRLDELIRQLCPNGVEFKLLGDVGQFIRGNGLQKSDLTDIGFPAIHYGQVHTHYGTSADTTISFVRPDFAKKLRRAEPGDLVIATTSEDDEAVGKAVAWIGTTAVAVSGDAYIYRHSLEPKYVSYFFQSDQFQNQKKRGITGTKVRRLSGDSLSKLRIPVPPIEVQREIVRILDTFSKLEVELEAELEARRIQYTYYRGQLLSFSDDVVRQARMSDVAMFNRGTAITARQAIPGDIPVVANGPVPTYTHSVANRNGETIVVARSGVYAGLVSFWNQPIFLTDAFSIHPDTEILKPKFVYYFLQNSQDNMHSMKKGAGVPHVRVREVEAYSIPIPRLEEQERIVSILDTFGALVNDLSIGLPAELKARRQQYEYYRDRLLTFKEAI